jgi:N-acetylneuraminic acid mutarotase
MATARQGQTATLLGNGKVLIVGGEGAHGVLLSSAELYDPLTNTWSSAGSMASTRFFQTATLLDNGKVLVVGGMGGSPNAALAGVFQFCDVDDAGLQ